MRAIAGSVLAVLGVLALQPAPAAEKAGNWTRITQTDIVDPNGALETLDPIVLKKMMKSTGTTTANYCAVENAPLATTFQFSPTLTCTMIDPQVEGATFHTEFACHGDSYGKGKMTITYDTAEHYTGESVYSPRDMMSLKWKSTFVGQWTGPTCSSP
jgi:hypothetical protein